MGNSPTPRQSLDIASRRKAISTRFVQHREQGLQFLPSALVEKAVSVPPSAVGKSELLPTILPSQLPGVASPLSQFKPITEVERSLRRATCLKALQTVRSVSVQKVHTLKGKKQHVSGIRGTTRAESILSRLAARVKHARWEYDSSRQRLIAMGLTTQDARTFKPLTDSDMEGLTIALQGKDRLGDGYAKMPWYWRVEMSKDSNDEHQIVTSGSAVRAEYEESAPTFGYILSFADVSPRHPR